MKMTFVRSGGFAGPMMRVEGAVDFEGDKAMVTSEARKYRRELDQDEARVLRDAASRGIGEAEGQVAPDSFQYDVTVTTADGKTRRGTLNGDSSNPLIQWIRKESDRIFSQK